MTTPHAVEEVRARQVARRKFYNVGGEAAVSVHHTLEDLDTVLREYDAVSRELGTLVIACAGLRGTLEAERHAMYSSSMGPCTIHETTMRGCMRCVIRDRDQLQAECETLRADLAEWEGLADLHHRREQPWIERWRQAAPGRERTLPDYGALLEFMAHEADQAKAALDAIVAALGERNVDGILPAITSLRELAAECGEQHEPALEILDQVRMLAAEWQQAYSTEFFRPIDPDTPEVSRDRVGAQMGRHLASQLQATLLGETLMEGGDTYRLDRREHAAVLAGLRLLQEELGEQRMNPAIHDIYTNAGDLVGLEAAEIDELCERLNTGG